MRKIQKVVNKINVQLRLWWSPMLGNEKSE